LYYVNEFVIFASLSLIYEMKALVLGAGGFIGNYLVKRLKEEGYYVCGIDLKYPEFSSSLADDFIIGDLRDHSFCRDQIKSSYDEIYQLAADMGGAGYLFSGENDYNVMHNSSLINLNITNLAIQNRIKKIFYSSSACIYPTRNQSEPENPECSESSAYPADPDSEYGWEKLFSERLYLSACRNHNLQTRIARFHNVYGTHGTWNTGKEKAPAALCRKVAETPDGGVIEIWGSGKQTRSFLYVDDCINGIRKLMKSDFTGPVNIGSEEKIAINDFARMIISVSGKNISIKNIDGPVGVNGRTSDNKLAKEKLNWEPEICLKDGITKTYQWIENQILHPHLASL
jgi:GDP-D-mannose 3',5'-epimerase